MKIGCPNHPRANLLEEIQWVGENEFDFMDLFFEPDCAMAETIDVAKTRELLQKYNLETVGHMAWYIPIGSPIASLRQASAAEVARTLPVMKELGVTYVTVHGNWASEKLFSIDETLGFQTETLTWMVASASKYGMAIMYEPVPDSRDSIENVAMLLERVPGLKLHLDMGHAFVTAGDPVCFAEVLSDYLVHVHLSDNNGAADQHLPLGCGRIDWAKAIETLKRHYDGTITLEIFAPDKEYVLLSKEKLRRLWDTAR